MPDYNTFLLLRKLSPNKTEEFPKPPATGFLPYYVPLKLLLSISPVISTWPNKVQVSASHQRLTLLPLVFRDTTFS